MVDPHEFLLNDPGLVENTKSEMHCMHACLMMALRTGRDVAVPSFDELDIVMKTDPRLYNWQYSIMRILAEKKFELRMIELFDTEEFLKNKEQYCLNYFGVDVGRDQIEKSDLAIVESDLLEVKSYQSDAFVVKEPDLSEIVAHIKDGWYCILNINQKVLQADPGYVGHMVFVYGVSSRGVRIHNPGPPAVRASEIAWPLLDKAWSYPSTTVRNILAVRYAGS